MDGSEAQEHVAATTSNTNILLLEREATRELQVHKSDVQ